MTEDVSNPKPSEENLETTIDPDEAAEAVKDIRDAMAILPTKRLGCLGWFAKCGAGLLVLFAVFVYWNLLRSPPLKISKETTYITEPLTSDGTRVDYFAVLEKRLNPVEMKSEDNGYRLVVRALGDGAEDGQAEARSAQLYEKLGLDPAIKPTMSHQAFWDYLAKYGEREGADETKVSEWYRQVYEPWTFDHLPMMKTWLEENGPVLDLLGRAVRKPTFCMPITRADRQSLSLIAQSPPNVQRMREFARSIAARANYRIGTGDVEGAIDDVVTCARLGRHLQRQPTVLAHVVGLAIEGSFYTIGIAASPEFQPTEEQLRRLAYEFNALPLRPNWDDTAVVARYEALDSLQTIAFGEESLAALFSLWKDIDWMDIDQYRPIFPPFAEFISVDWNVVMRRVNQQYDDMDRTRTAKQLSLLSPGDLFLGSRSQRVADALAELCQPSFQAMHESNRRSQCEGNLHRITLATLIYEREHGVLPPALTVDAAGKPLHSWRVLLLPYLGEDELYGKLRLDEPWDSEHNRRFHESAPAVYRCPSTQLAPGRTTYSVVVGKNTPFQAGEGKSLDAFGMNLLLVTEREQPIGWMDPTSELAEEIAIEGINRQRGGSSGIGSPHPNGPNAGLRDASTWFILKKIESSSLQDLLDGTAEDRP